MDKNIIASIYGIKCDNNLCDYYNKHVKCEDYINWINKPCPICGENLLTQSDYDMVQIILKNSTLIDNSNVELIEDFDHKYKVNLNGTGEVKVKRKRIK